MDLKELFGSLVVPDSLQANYNPFQNQYNCHNLRKIDDKDSFQALLLRFGKIRFKYNIVDNTAAAKTGLLNIRHIK